jgi:hypothetical protein
MAVGLRRANWRDEMTDAVSCPCCCADGRLARAMRKAGHEAASMMASFTACAA